MSPEDILQIHELLHDRGVPIDVTVSEAPPEEPVKPGRTPQRRASIAAAGREIIIDDHPTMTKMRVRASLCHYPHRVTLNGEILATVPPPQEAALELATTGHPLIHTPHYQPRQDGHQPGTLHTQGLAYRHGIREFRYRPAETQYGEHFTMAQRIAVEPHIHTEHPPEVDTHMVIAHQFNIPDELLRQAEVQHHAADAALGVDPQRPQPLAAWPPPPHYLGDDAPRNWLWTDLTPVNLDVPDPAFAYTVATALYGSNQGFIPVSEPVDHTLTFVSMTVAPRHGDPLTVAEARQSPQQRPIGARANSIILNLEVDGQPVEVSADIALCGSREHNNEAFFTTKAVTDPAFLTHVMASAFWQPPFHGAERFDNSRYLNALSTAAVRIIHGETAGLEHEASRLLENFHPQSQLPQDEEFSFRHPSGWTLSYRQQD